MARLEHLVVVVIPGIGGSVLETVGGQPIWGQGRRQLAEALWDPARLSLAEHPSLRPVDLLGSTRILPWKVVPGYDDLVRHLTNEFGLTDDDIDVARDSADGVQPKPGASVVLFPYDFRLGVRAAAEQLAAEMKRRLADRAEKRRQVIVLAHSMGGLVARYWLGPLRGARYCQALITLGTPHRGAPKALDWLLNGVRVGPGPVAALTSTLLADAAAVLREWPSTYDLLPRYRAVRDEESGREHYPHELGSAPFAKRAQAAFDMHQEIETEWQALDPAERPEVLALFARGHATPSRAVRRGDRVRITKTDAEWQPNAGWRGDGTVPALSAIPIELSEDVRARRAVPDRHGPMAGCAAAVEVLREYEAEPFGSVRGDAPDRPWLGLDLDEVVAAGEPFTVAAELLGSTAVEGASAWLRVAPDGGPTTAQPLRMTGADGRWQATVPGLAPGIYQVSVEAVNVPRVDQVLGGDVIGVIEP
ncbi:MAG: lipase/acyltransferase domain-containing protein [Pseudonocardiales bacterium]